MKSLAEVEFAVVVDCPGGMYRQLVRRGYWIRIPLVELALLVAAVAAAIVAVVADVSTLPVDAVVLAASFAGA